ncbi:MAG TPA: PH domain-containing protein [Actinocrinis sp.]|nr:PH domain-containing protein [Actinocrinis sp.]
MTAPSTDQPGPEQPAAEPLEPLEPPGPSGLPGPPGPRPPDTLPSSAAAPADSPADSSPDDPADPLNEWATPRRLHPLSIVVHLTKLLPRLLPIILIALLGGRSFDRSNTVSTGISAVVLGGGGFLVWLRTKFSVSGTELRMDSGILARRSRTASFDRIQTIDVNQQLVARMFGLAELRVQVAGGKEGHFLLACLPQGEAARLRALLLGQVGLDPGAQDPLGRTVDVGHVLAHIRGQGPTTDSAASTASATAEIPAARSPFASAAAPYQRGIPFGIEADEWPMVLVPNGRFIGAQFLSLAVWFATLVSLALIVTIVLTGPDSAGALIPVLLVPAGYLADRFQRYFGATLSVSADGLRLRHGLVNRFAQTIPRGRVQAYLIREPLLWRLCGFAQVKLNVAGYADGGGGRGESGQRNTSVLLPVVPREEAFALLGHLVGSDLRTMADRLSPAPERAFYRSGPWRRGYGFAADDRVLLTRSGLLHRSHAIVPHGKVQSMHLVQGPWQRALGLSTVKLHSTRGPVRILLKQRDAAEAERFLTEQAARSAAHRRAESAGPG